MKKMYLFFVLSCLVASFVASVSAVKIKKPYENNGIVPSTISKQDLEIVSNWSYVGEVLRKDLEDSETRLQQLGKFVNDYASYFSCLFGCVGYWLAEAETRGNSPKSGWFSRTIGSGQISSKFICPMLGFGVAFGIARWLLKEFGRRVEDKRGQCMQALNRFVNDWKIHKQNTPQFLHPRFEQLYFDVQTNGKITLMTLKQAGRFVEDLIATSLIVSVVPLQTEDA